MIERQKMTLAVGIPTTAGFVAIAAGLADQSWRTAAIAACIVLALGLALTTIGLAVDK